MNLQVAGPLIVEGLCSAEAKSSEGLNLRESTLGMWRSMMIVGPPIDSVVPVKRIWNARMLTVPRLGRTRCSNTLWSCWAPTRASLPRISRRHKSHPMHSHRIAMASPVSHCSPGTAHHD